MRSKEDGCLYAVKKSRDKFRGDADRYWLPPKYILLPSIQTLEHLNFSRLNDLCFAYRKYKLEEVNKHEILKHHPNCVQFIKAWEERLVDY